MNKLLDPKENTKKSLILPIHEFVPIHAVVVAGAKVEDRPTGQPDLLLVPLKMLVLLDDELCIMIPAMHASSTHVASDLSMPSRFPRTLCHETIWGLITTNSRTSWLLTRELFFA